MTVGWQLGTFVGAVGAIPVAVVVMRTLWKYSGFRFFLLKYSFAACFSFPWQLPTWKTSNQCNGHLNVRANMEGTGVCVCVCVPECCPTFCLVIAQWGLLVSCVHCVSLIAAPSGLGCSIYSVTVIFLILFLQRWTICCFLFAVHTVPGLTFLLVERADLKWVNVKLEVHKDNQNSFSWMFSAVRGGPYWQPWCCHCAVSTRVVTLAIWMRISRCDITTSLSEKVQHSHKLYHSNDQILHEDACLIFWTRHLRWHSSLHTLVLQFSS